jgi:hypothetical protein
MEELLLMVDLEIEMKARINMMLSDRETVL